MLKDLIQSALRRRGYCLRSTRHFGDNYWSDLHTLMVRQTSPRPVIFDVGAHHGETLLACRKFLPAATVHCFEPDPESAAILARCASGLENVMLHSVALGEVEGHAEFHRNCESMTNSLLPSSSSAAESEYANFSRTRELIQVPVETLDSFCQRENIHRLDLLKTDCQGFDLMVLKGGLEMIASHKIDLITCEVIFDHQYDGQGKFNELLGFLDAHDYRFMGFYNTARNSSDEATYCDTIFIRPSAKP